jgi:hypothetical protein
MVPILIRLLLVVATLPWTSSTDLPSTTTLSSYFTAGETGSFNSSEQCIAEGNVLANNTDLNAAKPKSGCVRTTRNGVVPSVCSVDYRQKSASYKAVCEAAMGQLWERSVVLKCHQTTTSDNDGTSSGSGSGSTTSNSPLVEPTVIVEYFNIPTCLGISCNLTIAKNEFDAFVPQELKQGLRDDQNLTCQATAQPAASISPTPTKTTSLATPLRTERIVGLWWNVLAAAVFGIAWYA